MASQLIHPELMRYVSDRRFNNIAKIEIAQITQDSTSGENTITYDRDPDLVAVPCQVDPQPAKAELRRPDLTLVSDAWQIMLDRYAPSITILSRVTLTDATIHNVIKVSHDDSHSHTVLDTEIVG